MINNNYKKAKKIFFDYGGIHSHMGREGYFNEYKSYNVDKEIEKKWGVEFRNQMLSEIEELNGSKEVLRKIHKLNAIISQYKDGDGLSLFVLVMRREMQKLDTFVSLIALEGILGNIKKGIANNTENIDFCVETLDLIIKNPIKVSAEHFEGFERAEHLAVENLIKRIERSKKSALEMKKTVYRESL